MNPREALAPLLRNVRLGLEDLLVVIHSLTTGLILGVALIVAYFITAQQVLEIASAGATIRLNASGTDKTKLEDFIEEVDRAKDARYLLALTTQKNPINRTSANGEAV